MMTIHIFRRCHTVSFYFIAILFLLTMESGCSSASDHANTPTSDSSHEHVQAFSADQLEENLEKALKKGEDSFRMQCLSEENLALTVETVLDAVKEDNYLVSCILSDISASYEETGDITLISFTLVPTETATFSGPIYTVTDQEQLEQLLGREFSHGPGKTAILLEDCVLSGDALLSVINNQEINSALAPTEATDIAYAMYPSHENQQFLLIWLELPLNAEEWERYQAELSQKTEDAVRQIEQLSAQDGAACYQEIYQYIIESAEYDSALSGATLLGAEHMSLDMHMNRSAYGALVSGRTVCTGYARAFKAVCDELGLPCWVLAGTHNGMQHAWNAVQINGETYYVDCTLADTNASDATFLFTEKEAEADGYVTSDYSVLPW